VTHQNDLNALKMREKSQKVTHSASKHFYMGERVHMPVLILRFPAFYKVDPLKCVTFSSSPNNFNNLDSFRCVTLATPVRHPCVTCQATGPPLP
jgi:hypothetical protein